MGVKKIFIILITVVACILIGWLLLNVLLPNTATAIVQAIEDAIQKATGLEFDLNGDGVVGSSGAAFGGGTTGDIGNDTVEGFK